MSEPDMDNTQLAERYQLLCEATRVDAGSLALPEALETALTELDQLLDHRLPALAMGLDLQEFQFLHHSMRAEAARLRMYASLPNFSRKTVVAIGGAFSAGKSSLINTLLGKRWLASEVSETTALPAWLMAAEQDSIVALNHHQRQLRLTDQQFLSLTHDEKAHYGSDISHQLAGCWLGVSGFPWQNLALLDTPGYSRRDDFRSAQTGDAALARVRLNGSHAIIWLVQAEAGVIPESDLQFIATLRRDIPLLVLISRADKKQDAEIAAITQLTQQTLAARGIPVLAVVPFSSRNKSRFPLERLTQWLNKWDSIEQNPGFSLNFRRLMSRGQLAQHQQQLKLSQRISALNRALSLTDEESVISALTPLRQTMQQENEQSMRQSAAWQHWQSEVVDKLAQIGQLADIAMPEPTASEMQAGAPLDLGNLLNTLRLERGLPETNAGNWQKLLAEGVVHHRQRLLLIPTTQDALARFSQAGTVAHRDRLVGHIPVSATPLLP